MIELPLFPLPNLVFFPHTTLPLHIFEPRYRRMTEEALENSSLIGMVLLKHGREDALAPGRDCHRIGSAGEITRCIRLEDGRFLIHLEGRSRFRVVELLRDQPYRLARACLLEDELPSAAKRQRLSTRLIDAFGKLSLHRGPQPEPARLSEMDFPALVNSVCSTLRIDDRSKQLLLEMDDLESRAESTLQMIHQLTQQERLMEPYQHLRPNDPSLN